MKKVAPKHKGPEPKEYAIRPSTNPYGYQPKPGNKKMTKSPEVYGKKASEKIQLKLNDKRKGKKFN